MTQDDILISQIESDGFIIDIREISNSEMITSWKVDLLFNSYQTILTFYKKEKREDRDEMDYDYKIEIEFSEIVLTKEDEKNILIFLIIENKLNKF
jgi:hypothetical protein